MYNVKMFIYPDLSRQVRVYRVPIGTNIIGDTEKDWEIRIPEINPFDYSPVRSLDDIERSQDVSRNRTINMIYMYSRSNVWEYFVTLTFASSKVNRYDYSECSKKLSQWLKDMKKRYCPDMRYIIVPELHKDGAFHFHGLFSSVDGLEIIDSGKTVVQKYMRGNRKCFRRTNETIYLFGRYKLGWMTATRVKSNTRVIKYITKYVTKELVANSKGKKRYWISKNLDVPIEEVMLLNSEERFVFQHEISEDAIFEKHIECKEIRQIMSIYELE